MLYSVNSTDGHDMWLNGVRGITHMNLETVIDHSDRFNLHIDFFGVICHDPPLLMAYSLSNTFPSSDDGVVSVYSVNAALMSLRPVYVLMFRRELWFWYKTAFEVSELNGSFYWYSMQRLSTVSRHQWAWLLLILGPICSILVICTCASAFDVTTLILDRKMVVVSVLN